MLIGGVAIGDQARPAAAKLRPDLVERSVSHASVGLQSVRSVRAPDGQRRRLPGAGALARAVSAGISTTGTENGA